MWVNKIVSFQHFLKNQVELQGPAISVVADMSLLRTKPATHNTPRYVMPTLI